MNLTKNLKITGKVEFSQAEIGEALKEYVMRRGYVPKDVNFDIKEAYYSRDMRDLDEDRPANVSASVDIEVKPST